MKITIVLLLILSYSFISDAQTENYWTKISDFNGLKRTKGISFSINGDGFVGTGEDTTETVKKDLWKYNSATDTWTQMTDLPGLPRRNAVSFVINNFGFVGTGITNSNSLLGVYLNDFYFYDSNNNTWSSISSFPGSSNLGIYNATAFSINNKGYVCCGKKGISDYSNEFWEYNFSTDTWTELTEFPGGVRQGLISFVVDDKAYVGLGKDLDLYRKDIWEFDPSTNQWTQKNDFIGSERAGSSAFTLGQRGFVCLGTDGGYKKDLFEYNPFNDSWSIRADFGGSARKDAFSFVIGDTAYVGCGKGVSGKKMSFYAYVPYRSALNINESQPIELSTYPNPINEVLNININNSFVYSITIYDMMGHEVYITLINASHLLIDRKNISSGTYILVAKNTAGQPITSKKIIFK